MPPPATPKRARARQNGHTSENPQPYAYAPGEVVENREPGSQPPPPGRRMSWPAPPNEADENWFTWLSQFSPDDWDNMLGYLYRTAPKIDRRANGKPTSLAKFSHFFDQEDIKLNYGSGGYRIDLTVRDPVSGRMNRLCQHYFNILNLDYPPRVPPGDWVDEPENDAWKWAKPLLEAGAAATVAQMTNPAGDPNKLFDTVLSGIERLRPAENGNGMMAAELIKGMNQMQQYMLQNSDPVKQLQMLATLMPKPEAKDDTLTKFLFDELKAMRQELRDARLAAAPKSIIEQLKELLPMAKEMLSLTGTGRGEKSNPWAEVLTSVVDKLGEHVPTIVDAFKNGGGGSGGFRLNGPQPQAQPQPGAAQPQPAAPDTPIDPESVLTKEQQMKMQTIIQNFGALIQQVTPFLIDHFTTNMTGFDFRDWFLARYGMNNWTALRVQVGAQDLCDLAQHHDMLKQALAPPEKLLVFLNEFFTPEGEEPEGAVDRGTAGRATEN
jgi:hypothetical protein